MIRVPDIQDADACAKLLYLSGPNVFNYFFVADKSAILEIIKMMFTKSDILFSRENILIDGNEDTVRGLILVVPAAKLKVMEKNISKYGKELVAITGFFKAIRMFFRQGLSEYMAVTDNSELYVSNLAVSDQHKRGGVATTLLQKAEEIAKGSGLTRLSLLVESENAAAMNLYEKSGFKKDLTVSLPKKYSRYHLTGFTKMVKDV